MEQGSAAGTASRPGYIVVLVGVAAFVASCFLPYYDPGTLPTPLASLSLFRLMTSFRESELAMIGGVINLFAGVTVVAWVSIAGLRGLRWAPTALLAVSAAWSLTWIGVLLNVSGFVVRSPLVGYWLIFVSIGVVITGRSSSGSRAERTSPPALRRVMRSPRSGPTCRSQTNPPTGSRNPPPWGWFRVRGPR